MSATHQSRIRTISGAIIALLGFFNPAQAQPSETLAAEAAAATDAAAATATPCLSGPVVSIDIAGCETNHCATDEAKARLLSLIDMTAGDTLTTDQIHMAHERLGRTGMFRRTTFVCSDAPADVQGAQPKGVRVVLEVVPNTYVRRVRIRGNRFMKEYDIRKRVFLRPGTILNADPGRPQENEQIARQIQSVRRLYETAGLSDVDVWMTLEPPAESRGGEGADETSVELIIHISEGVRLRVDDMLITHVHRVAPDPDGLTCPTITQSQLERLVDINYGSVYTTRTAREVKKRLKAAFQAAGFVRPQITVGDLANGTELLEVTIRTERCWLIRIWERESPFGGSTPQPAFRIGDPIEPGVATEVDSAPFRRADLAEWAEDLSFAESGVFDREESARGLRAITGRLVAKGYPFAEVRLEHRDLSLTAKRRGGASDVRGTIDYTITRNHERRVRAIYLTTRPGDTALTTDETAQARGLMQTQPYDFFGSSGHFNADRVFHDLAVLKRHHLERGYHDFRFDIQGDPQDTGPTRTLTMGSAGRCDPPSARHEPRPQSTAEATADANTRPSGGGASRAAAAQTGRATGAHDDDDACLIWTYRQGDRGFLLKKRRGDLALIIEIPLSRGPQTKVGAFEIDGATQLSVAEVITISGLGPGRAVGPFQVEAGIAALERWYRARGYYLIEVVPSCEADASKSGDDLCDPRQIVRADSIDLGLRIREGRQIFVGEVFVRGNFQTDPWVLERDLPKAGDPLDQARIDEAVRRARSLGIFNSVRVEIIGLNESPPRERVALMVSVEEAGYRFLDFAIGIQSIRRANIGKIPAEAASIAGNEMGLIDRYTTGFGRAFPLEIPDILFVFEFEYLDLNLRGLGHQLKLPVKAGISLSQFLRLAQFTPTYVWPRLGDTRLRLETKLIAELDRVTNPLDRLELGLQFDFSLPITRRMLAGLTLRGGMLQLQDPDKPCLFCLESPDLGFGSALVDKTAEETAQGAACDDPNMSDACERTPFQPQFTVSLRWRWDEQDSPLHPTRGYSLTSSTSFILDQDRQSRSADFNQFVKWELSGRLAIPLRGPILALFARYGGAVTFGDRFLPANERFTLGGSNGMRGFLDQGICRYDKDGELDPECPTIFGGNVLINGSLELRVPILPSIGLWIAAFVDVGALSERHDTLYGSSFRFSTGAGIRWLIAGQIPLRLDLGFPLGRRCLTPAVGGVCIVEDASAVHFRFLYPF